MTDFNKLNLSRVQLRSVYEDQMLILTNKMTGKQKAIKEETVAFIRFKNDTNKKEIALNAFFDDSVIISLYEPTLINKEIKLDFSEYKLIPLKQVESISYSIKHRRRAYWGGFILTLTGFEFVFLPVVMPLFLGNAKEIYSKPFFPYMVGGGVASLILGRKLLNSLKFKDYNLNTDWEYRVVKM